MTDAPISKRVSIHIRAKAWQRNLIDQAAHRLGCSRSDFILEVSCREAQEVLQDLVLTTMDSGAFAEFQRSLDKPLAPNDNLRFLLKTKAPWE